MQVNKDFLNEDNATLSFNENRFRLLSNNDLACDYIECKSVLTSPIIISQQSPFVFPKRACIRLSAKNTNNKYTYYFDIKFVNSSKPSITLEVSKILI